MIDRANNQNRRLFYRIRKTLLVYYEPISSSVHLSEIDTKRAASTLDLSSGGALLRMTERMDVGTKLDLRLDILDDFDKSKTLEFFSRVVRCDQSDYSSIYYVAVEFLSLSSQEVKLLKSFVQRMRVE